MVINSIINGHLVNRQAFNVLNACLFFKTICRPPIGVKLTKTRDIETFVTNEFKKNLKQ